MRIETERLVIRSFARSDLPTYAAIVADPRVTKYLADGSPHSLAEAEAYLLDCIARDDATGIARYAHGAWGRGYATEAALRVLEYGIHDLGLSNIAAGAYTDNIASVKIIRRLGFKRFAAGQFHGKATVRYFQKDIN